MYKSSRRKIITHHIQAKQEKKEQEIGAHMRDLKGQASTYFQNQGAKWKFCSRTTRMANTFAESNTK